MRVIEAPGMQGHGRVMELTKGIHMKKYDWFRTRAKEMYHEDGEIEVDSDARVSVGENGAYVAAWVWVPYEEPRVTIPTPARTITRGTGRILSKPS
jgi:hypothetical protein